MVFYQKSIGDNLVIVFYLWHNVSGCSDFRYIEVLLSTKLRFFSCSGFAFFKKEFTVIGIKVREFPVLIQDALHDVFDFIVHEFVERHYRFHWYMYKVLNVVRVCFIIFCEYKGLRLPKGTTFMTKCQIRATDQP